MDNDEIHKQFTQDAIDILIGKKIGGKEHSQKEWIEWRYNIIDLALRNRAKDERAKAVAEFRKLFEAYNEFDRDENDDLTDFGRGQRLVIDKILASLDALTKKPKV